MRAARRYAYGVYADRIRTHACRFVCQFGLFVVDGYADIRHAHDMRQLQYRPWIRSIQYTANLRQNQININSNTKSNKSINSNLTNKSNSIKQINLINNNKLYEYKLQIASIKFRYVRLRLCSNKISNIRYRKFCQITNITAQNHK